MSMQAHQGSCQCGAVRFRATVDLDDVMVCNCSRCGRIGTIFTFTPAEKFELISGADAMTEYQFNRNVIHHLFCATCGVESFARGTGPDGSAMVAVNARCLEGVEPDELTPKKVDGRRF